MIVYSVMHEDRHADTEVLVYLNPAKAVSEATRRLIYFDRFKDAKVEDLDPSMSSTGIVWRGHYGETSYITVRRHEVTE